MMVETYPELVSVDRDVLLKTSQNIVQGIKENTDAMAGVPSNEHIAEALASFVYGYAGCMSLHKDNRHDQAIFAQLYPALAYYFDFGSDFKARVRTWSFCFSGTLPLADSLNTLFSSITFEETLENAKAASAPSLPNVDDVSPVESSPESPLPEL